MMSSLSEKEYYNLTVSISKALNMIEAPLKIKHARSIIITTHRTNDIKTFWAIISKQPLMANRFTAWKFCHLLHKILREGHQCAIKHSQSQKQMLTEMGKLWGHLQDGVGVCIQSYTKLLVTKLCFHEKYSCLPGSLAVPFKDLEKFAGSDINIYFHFCVEIFDYLDDIIALEEKVFSSVEMYRMSSMTPQGQCRLAPLVTLIQDSNPLYDFAVRVMFKLYDNLPNDVLSGHQDRFRDIFIKLKTFYDKVRPLQYFANLIQVPFLPENAPNFLSKIDFGNYEAPVVTIPEADPEIYDDLVDVSITDKDAMDASSLSGIQHNFDQEIRDKNSIIEKLEKELEAMKGGLEALEQNHIQEVNILRNKVRQLVSELKLSTELYADTKLVKDELEKKVLDTTDLIKKITVMEEKSAESDAKFLKLKTMYTEMREKHISLLRQNGEATKLYEKEKSLNVGLENKREHFENVLSDLRNQLQMANTENENLQLVIKQISEEKNRSERGYEELKLEIDDLKNFKHIKQEELKKMESSFEMKNEELQDLKACNERLNNELREKENKFLQRETSFEKTITDLNFEIQAKNDCISEKEIYNDFKLKELNNEILEAKKNCDSLAQTVKQKNDDIADLLPKLNLAAKQVEELSNENLQLKTKLQEIIKQNQLLTEDKIVNELKNKKTVIELFDEVCKAAQEIILSNSNDVSEEQLKQLFTTLEETKAMVDELFITYSNEKSESRKELIQKIVLLCYKLTVLREASVIVNNTTGDMKKGENLLKSILALFDPADKIFVKIRSGEQCEVVETHVSLLKSKLQLVEEALWDLKKVIDNNMDLGDIIQSELSDMEKTIAEASAKFIEMLSHSKNICTGIKLEVNEKILDACTHLMECIRMLIKKAKTLQDEIVSTGRGKSSVKEFYKRNSEWTEGLISASKSVAKGANFLVDVADKAVLNESGQNFEIIVAAQEIAACTAQLVIASKVKSQKDSDKLVELTKASRMVSQATGAVVAIVKDSYQRLEDYTDLDLSKLTASQAKTMEMDMHVKVLELEQSLQTERFKLLEFRKKLYHNSEN